MNFDAPRWDNRSGLITPQAAGTLHRPLKIFSLEGPSRGELAADGEPRVGQLLQFLLQVSDVLQLTVRDGPVGVVHDATLKGTSFEGSRRSACTGGYRRPCGTAGSRWRL